MLQLTWAFLQPFALTIRLACLRGPGTEKRLGPLSLRITDSFKVP